jgi:catechol 2,3-dioxygenase-like lactoylglutathione lyase family enzyme
MPTLDHVNVQTHRLAETVAFYRDVIGLEVRDPPGLDPALIQWMYDEAGRGIVHISTAGSLGKGGQPVAGGGSVHHVALLCSGHEAMVATLQRHGLQFRLNHVLAIDLKQIFVEDPNGVLLELNFPKGRH